jgi:hypothetical protein
MGSDRPWSLHGPRTLPEPKATRVRRPQGHSSGVTSLPGPKAQRPHRPHHYHHHHTRFRSPRSQPLPICLPGASGRARPWLVSASCTCRVAPLCLSPTAVGWRGLTLGRQPVAAGDFGLSGLAALQGPALFGEQGSRGPVNAAVHCGGRGVSRGAPLVPEGSGVTDPALLRRPMPSIFQSREASQLCADSPVTTPPPPPTRRGACFASGGTEAQRRATGGPGRKRGDWQGAHPAHPVRCWLRRRGRGSLGNRAHGGPGTSSSLLCPVALCPQPPPQRSNIGSGPWDVDPAASHSGAHFTDE